MNRPRDDEYGSLSDLLGGFEQDDSADPADSVDFVEDDLPAGLPPEYVDAYRRGYERARRGEEPTVGLEHELAAALASRRVEPEERADESRVDESRPDEPRAHESRPDESRPDESLVGEPHAPESRVDERRAHESRAEECRVGNSRAEASRVDEPRPDESRADEPARPSVAGWGAGEPRVEEYEPTRAIPAGSVTPPRPSYAEEPTRDEDRRKPPVTLIALGALALLLILAAFGIGRLFADDTAQDEPAASDTSGETGGGGETGEGGGSQEKSERYAGPVDAVTIAGATATCQTANSVDAAGNPTSYEPARAFDSDISTAWRCDGSGQGQRFTVQLPGEMAVAEVGLVPGFAKTDPASGVDRYAENNRITKLRWRFDDGTTIVQRIDGNPGNRSMRTIRVPETTTRSVVIEILASQPGPRNTVAISELRIATPAG